MTIIDAKKIQDLIVEFEGEMVIITINRPTTLNALTISVFAQLEYVFEYILHLKEIRCIVITGAGQKAFVAGADIGEFTKIAPGTAHQFLSLGNKVLTTIENFPKPIIAAVNGFALGGGCELAMACHMRIASETSKFGLPEINLGIMPGYGGTQRLPRIVGKGRAYEMMLTGEMIDAPKAFEIGLISHIHKVEELLNKAKSLANRIISKPPLSIINILKAVRASDGDLQNGITLEGKLFTECTNTKDFEEGVNAFFEKRKPEFKGE